MLYRAYDTAPKETLAVQPKLSHARLWIAPHREYHATLANSNMLGSVPQNKRHNVITATTYCTCTRNIQRVHTCFPASAGLTASAQLKVFVVLLEQRQVPLQKVQDPVCNDRRIRSAWVSIENCYDQSYSLAKLNAAQAQQNSRKRFKSNRKTCSRAAPLQNIAATCTHCQQLHAPTQDTATTVWR
jgi:hypothetical protein